MNTGDGIGLADARAGGWAHGIDVSNNQGRIDWPQVFATGLVEFVIAKASEGASFVDHWLAAYAAACDAAGVARGIYHFARPSRSRATEEADLFVSCANAVGWDRDVPFVLDLEDEDYAPGEDAGGWALDWCERVRARTGRRALVYTYRYYITSRKLDRYPALAEYGLWLAAVDGTLGATPSPWGSVPLWQYHWRGQIDGIAGPVDLNWCRAGGADAFRRLSDDAAASVTPEAAISAGIVDPVTGYTVDPAFVRAWSMERDGRPLAGSALYSDGVTRQLFERSVLETNGRGEPTRGGVGQALAAVIGRGTRPDWPDVHPLL